MGNELGRMWFILGLSTKDFNKELGGLEKNIKSSMGNIKKELEKAGVALTAFGAAITVALGKAVTGFAEFGDELVHLSEKTGISVESLSELKYVGDQTGISLDQMALAVKGMANFLETARDGSSTAAKALRQLGISVSDLKGLTPEQMFMTLANAIAAVPDPLTRSALAVDIFGRSGTDMLPMLSLGADGIQKLRDRAHELGITMTGEAAEGAHALSNAFKDVKSAVGGLGNAVGEVLAPVLIWLVNDLILPVITGIRNWAAEHPELFKWIVIVTGAIGVLALALGGLLLALAGLIIIAPVVAAAWALITGPIGLIVIGIMAVIAVILLLWKYWHEVWDGIKWFTREVVNFIINQVLGMVNSFVNMFVGMINGVISLLNFLPGVDIKKVATLNLHYEVPEFAGGGIFTAPTLGIIGEAGPEAVMPLDKLGSVGGGARSVVNNFSFPNYLGSRDDLINAMREGLYSVQKDNSSLSLA